MRTTLRIHDDLMRELKRRARAQGSSLATLVNRVIRHGLEVGRRRRATRRHREKTASMGRPTLNLDKALAIAAGLEDESAAEKLARRK
jgi:hypothetical protein